MPLDGNWQRYNNEAILSYYRERTQEESRHRSQDRCDRAASGGAEEIRGFYTIIQTASQSIWEAVFTKINTMSNTSTIHIKTDFDCKVYDYGQELGTTKADTYFNIELRKGDHELSFVFIGDESVSKAINYFVEDVDCDLKLTIEIAEVICNRAKQLYDSKEYSSAFNLFTILAEQGYANAQCQLGYSYSHGEGVEIDPTKAAAWYTKAAEQGHAKAQEALGLYYYYVYEFEQAVEWLTKAAKQGCVEAQTQKVLGDCYANGEGVNIDLKKAFEWYTKAAEQGDAWAQFELGSCYYNGKGVEENRSKAIEWWAKAAEQGFGYAQLELGDCYENGDGVEKNLAKAIEWYTKAYERGGFSSFSAAECLNRIYNQTQLEQPSAVSINNIPIHYLFFDTETAGLPKNYHALTHWLSNWPRLVQLSWITTDEDCNVLSENDYIIYPDGFTIPEDAVRLHGITTEIAKEKGKPIKEVIDKFMEDFNAAKTIVGHNIDFDKKIIGAELIRLGQNDIMSSKEALCTMKGSVDFCKISSSHGYKWPKLQELHKKLFGYEFEDAHNSMSDVKATLKCFKEMKKLGWI